MYIYIYIHIYRNVDPQLCHTWVCCSIFLPSGQVYFCSGSARVTGLCLRSPWTPMIFSSVHDGSCMFKFRLALDICLWVKVERQQEWTVGRPNVWFCGSKTPILAANIDVGWCWNMSSVSLLILTCSNPFLLGQNSERNIQYDYQLLILMGHISKSGWFCFHLNHLNCRIGLRFNLSLLFKTWSCTDNIPIPIPKSWVIQIQFLSAYSLKI